MTSPRLDKELGLFAATALVIGSVIGSGIFVSSAGMARAVPSAPQLMTIWVLAGLITACGALTQAELCSRRPVTGGLYVYFREMFGNSLAFVYGWANLMIAGSGALAAIAFVFAAYLGEFIALPQASPAWQEWFFTIPYLGRFFPAAFLGEKLVGAALIVSLTALNMRGVRLGSLVQSTSTTAKAAAILLVILVAFLWKGDPTVATAGGSTTPMALSMATVSAWTIALGGAFWAFDGWGNVAYVGGEVRDPRRNLPRAILLGLAIVTVIYLLMNAAYLHVLSVDEIAHAPRDRVASAVMGRLLGPVGAAAIAALIVLSAFDTVNSGILTNARVYFAMSQDGLLWRMAGQTHPRFHTPVGALGIQAAWAVVLLMTGSFEVITSMYVFVNWAFYVLIPISLVLMRRRDRGDEHRGFRVPFYPLLPALFGLFAAAYLVQTLVSDVTAYQAGRQPVVNSVVGVVLVLAGLPVGWILRRRRAAG